MTQKGLYRIGFIEEVKAQILEMRYTKGKLSMFVLLPSHSKDNLKALEEVNLHFHISTKYSMIDPQRTTLSTTDHLEEIQYLSCQTSRNV